MGIMKKRGIVVVISLITLLLISIGLVSAIDITTCTELQNINNNMAGSYILKNDIDCGGVNFYSIGNSQVSISFTGTLDGNGHTIRNLNIVKIEDLINTAMIPRYAGLFSLLGDGTSGKGIVRNLKIDGFTSTSPGGSIAGIVKPGALIDKCSVENVNINTQIPGAAGAMIVGGLVGSNDGIIRNSYITKGSVTVSGNVLRVGGFVGNNLNLIENSYSTLKVQASSITGTVGGFAGSNRETVPTQRTGTINRCFSTGDVQTNNVPDTARGAFVGSIGVRGVINNGGYWYNNLADTITWSGCVCPLPCTNECQDCSDSICYIKNDIDYFRGVISTNAPFTGWDFVNIWAEIPGDFPKLKWEIPEEESCGDGIIQVSRSEQCDDGNTNSNDGCSSTCQVENTFLRARISQMYWENSAHTKISSATSQQPVNAVTQLVQSIGNGYIINYEIRKNSLLADEVVSDGSINSDNSISYTKTWSAGLKENTGVYSTGIYHFRVSFDGGSTWFSTKDGGEFESLYGELEVTSTTNPTCASPNSCVTGTTCPTGTTLQSGTCTSGQICCSPATTTQTCGNNIEEGTEECDWTSDPYCQDCICVNGKIDSPTWRGCVWDIQPCDNDGIIDPGEACDSVDHCTNCECDVGYHTVADQMNGCYSDGGETTVTLCSDYTTSATCAADIENREDLGYWEIDTLGELVEEVEDYEEDDGVCVVQLLNLCEWKNNQCVLTEDKQLEINEELDDCSGYNPDDDGCHYDDNQIGNCNTENSITIEFTPVSNNPNLDCNKESITISCVAKLPFFTWMNILLVIGALVVFYVLFNLSKKGKKRK